MSSPRPIRVLVAASEVVGFAKTGGLADVAGSLPRALSQRGHSVAVAMPLYAAVRRGAHSIAPTPIEFTISLGQRAYTGRLCRTTLPRSDVPIYLVEQAELFERDDPDQGHGLYQYSTPDGRKHDYPDSAERYVFFCRALMESLPRIEPRPELLHCNDWQTAMLPAYAKEHYGYGNLKTLLTIHNIAYQGGFPAGTMSVTGLNPRLFNHRQLEFYGQLNFLKAGCVFADAINTVSPRYAQEIQTSAFGCGLEGVLAERRAVLSGIVNGVDYREWDPSVDQLVVERYSADTVFERKPINKLALQRELSLPERSEVPLLGVVARLVDQKGITLLIQSAYELFGQDLQAVVLGEGDPVYHRQLRELQSRFPKKFGLRLGFDEALAHRIEAGADMFLMPSQYEPSGLNQLYSLRYGTVPIVRSVGGLADTITDVTPESRTAGTATGFRFDAATPAAFQHAIHRALACWWQEPQAWRQIVQTGMRQDWSWGRSAAEYEALYLKLLS